MFIMIGAVRSINEHYACAPSTEEILSRVEPLALSECDCGRNCQALSPRTLIQVKKK